MWTAAINGGVIEITSTQYNTVDQQKTLQYSRIVEVGSQIAPVENVVAAIMIESGWF